MGQYMKNSDPSAGVGSPGRTRAVKCSSSVGQRPPGEIRHEKHAPSTGQRPPAEICHGNCCFSYVKHIYCVFLEFYIWNQHWERHGETHMTKLVWHLFTFICFGRDNDRIKAQLVRILIQVAGIRKLTLASICLPAYPMIWLSNRQKKLKNTLRLSCLPEQIRKLRLSNQNGNA